MGWKEELKNFTSARLICDTPMADYTTYKTGGPAEVIILPQSVKELGEVLKFAQTKKIDFRLLGLGSNILAGDKGLPGITCCLKNMQSIEFKDNLLTAAAGAALDRIVGAAVNAGLEGMEDLSGIPGSAGGAVYMNAGAYGQETFDRLESFDVMDSSGNIKTLARNEVKHGYRKVEGLESCIILSATWRLKPAADADALKARRAQILVKRAEKQPLDYPSAGSVFKRPPNNYASALIDQCGLKGLRAGGAMVSTKHAGFIINYDKASAADIKELMTQVQTLVLEKTGVKLELEQILWGIF
jgi:UDP-N-acetylmuramate dehydrogenase